MIVVNNTATPANSGSGAAAKIGIIGRCPKFVAGRVCRTPLGVPETSVIIPRRITEDGILVGSEGTDPKNLRVFRDFSL